MSADYQPSAWKACNILDWSPGHDTALPVGERGLIQSMDQDIITHADGIIATLALISALYVAILAWCKQSTDI